LRTVLCSSTFCFPYTDERIEFERALLNASAILPSFLFSPLNRGRRKETSERNFSRLLQERSGSLFLFFFFFPLSRADKGKERRAAAASCPETESHTIISQAFLFSFLFSLLGCAQRNDQDLSLTTRRAGSQASRVSGSCAQRRSATLNLPLFLPRPPYKGRSARSKKRARPPIRRRSPRDPEDGGWLLSPFPFPPLPFPFPSNSCWKKRSGLSAPTRFRLYFALGPSSFFFFTARAVKKKPLHTTLGHRTEASRRHSDISPPPFPLFPSFLAARAGQRGKGFAATIFIVGLARSGLIGWNRSSPAIARVLPPLSFPLFLLSVGQFLGLPRENGWKRIWSNRVGTRARQPYNETGADPFPPPFFFLPFPLPSVVKLTRVEWRIEKKAVAVGRERR